MDRSATTLLLACILGGVVPPAFGQPDVIQPGEERFAFGLGVTWNSFSSKLRVDNQSQGSDVNLRNDLGLENQQTSYWVNAEWRFAPRHRIGINYSQFKLSGSGTAPRELQVGDEIYPAGTTVDTELRVRFVPLTYSYSFLKRDYDELAATVGIYWSSLRFTAHGSASTGGKDIDNDVNASVDVPLPLIGLRYEHNFSSLWSAGLQGGVLKISYDKDPLNVKGDLYTARTSAEYRFAKHMGLGLAVEAVLLDIKVTKNSLQGRLEYWYWAPQLYLKARF